jgi:hypothetical protein
LQRETNLSNDKLATLLLNPLLIDEGLRLTLSFLLSVLFLDEKNQLSEAFSRTAKGRE